MKYQTMYYFYVKVCKVIYIFIVYILMTTNMDPH
jgi:hypothetical protein